MQRGQRLSITGDDGGIVMSLQVPPLPRVQSAPNMAALLTSLDRGGPSSADHSSCEPKQVVKEKVKARLNDVQFENKIKKEPKDKQPGHGKPLPPPPAKMNEVDLSTTQEKDELEMSKKEWVTTYSLHVFVLLIFLITVLSVSLSWYYRNLSIQMLQKTQKVFFDPRTRKLALSDPSDTVAVEGILGLDIPRWQLPLHCPLVVGQDPSMRSCEWKNNAVLSIDHFGDTHVQCYNVTWKSKHPKNVPYDCFKLKGSEWYGPSNQSEIIWPIRGSFSYQPSNQRPDYNGVFGSVVDLYWLSSSGVGLRVHRDDPVYINWNRTGDNYLCIVSNYTGSLYDQYKPPKLSYTICNGRNPVTTHSFMQKIFPPKRDIKFPPMYVFKGYFWSVRGILGRRDNVSQDDVIELASRANNISSWRSSSSSSSLHSNNNVKLSIDTDWQREEGDFTFDPELYPNVTDFTQTLASMKTLATLSLSPHVYFSGDNFRQGISSHFFVKGAGGEVAGLVHFKDGVAAVLDVTRDGVSYWLRERIKKLLTIPVFTSLRLTNWENPWLPYKPHFGMSTGTPELHRERLVELLSDLANGAIVVENTGNTRHVTQLIPVKSRVQYDSLGRKCLHGTIATALSVGLMGYPFVMADGLEDDSQLENFGDRFDGYTSLPDRELYIRWLLLAALFPAAQLSSGPWQFDDEVVSMATNSSLLHHNRVLPILKSPSLREEVANGMPILRPVWWIDPTNTNVHEMKIDDEFLIGESLLVAPVLCKGVRKRDVFIPPGVWEDIHLSKVIIGPNSLTDYPVSLHQIALFRRREIVL